MSSDVTLAQLSKLQNILSKGIKVYVCKQKEKVEVVSVFDMENFTDIQNIFGRLAKKYNVYRLDTQNDIISIYVKETDL